MIDFDIQPGGQIKNQTPLKGLGCLSDAKITHSLWGPTDSYICADDNNSYFCHLNILTQTVG